MALTLWVGRTLWVGDGVGVGLELKLVARTLWVGDGPLVLGAGGAPDCRYWVALTLWVGRTLWVEEGVGAGVLAAGTGWLQVSFQKSFGL